MTYPIGNIVFGIPQTPAVLDIVIPADTPGLEDEAGMKIRDVDDLLNCEISHGGFGFEGLYSASPEMDDTAGYFGILLWDGPYWELTVAIVAGAVPTDLHRREFQNMLMQLPPWFRLLLPDPEVHIVWSDS